MSDVEGAPARDNAPSIAETHIGMVVLVGDRAYKSKKPVQTAFLDFSTPERRAAALRRELELNRRLSPDVYLGLGRFSGPEQPDETVLVMRRMPADRRLSTLVLAGAPVQDVLRDLARLMATFHTRAGRGRGIVVDGAAAALRGRWRANVAELACYQGAPLPDGIVDEIGRLATRFVAGRSDLLAGRCADGWVVDGHGDLIADDVFCLPDGPRVLDCLDFDDHLRHVDALDDVAFLAMDLERLGRADLGTVFLDAYAEFAGDPAPASLRHHYIAYRALVRAKVACLRHDQTGADSDAAAAVRYAELSRAHLRSGAVRLALVGGLPGTGKSTIAGALADRCEAVLLSSDRVRKELAGLDPTGSAPAGFREGLYSADHTEALYTHLLERAEALLARGESVVLDASWTSRHHRAAAAALATRSSGDLVALDCRAPAGVAAQRIHTRGATASDATAAIAGAWAAAADPWPDATVIDTTAALDRCVADALDAWCPPPKRVLRVG
jgi:aminoglycoside phosphotransferase family enzyme/predicted kinase